MVSSLRQDLEKHGSNTYVDLTFMRDLLMARSKKRGNYGKLTVTRSILAHTKFLSGCDRKWRTLRKETGYEAIPNIVTKVC